MPLPPPPPQSGHSRTVFRNNLNGETAYQRHQRYVHSARLYGDASLSGESSAAKRTDFDVLKASHRFLRDDDDDGEEDGLSYDETVALKYYRSLFKEFAICDLKHYKSGNVSLRWRTEDEVVSGAGQFSCGNTRCKWHAAEEVEVARKPPALITLEVPFGYIEHGEAKSALVKLVLCSKCKKKLTWKRDKEKAAQLATSGTRNAEPEDGESEEEEGPALPQPSSSRREEIPKSRHRSRSRDRQGSPDGPRRHRPASSRRSASPPPRRQRP
ncbi:hypothetical protein M407DRAFT_243580 [Tulasnella calospora MUT 4182]|uniref:Protein FRA10AC1 n=1 Tax=Tulasnella calospora MUT 4182 TaxID=1051891 RepID=A0A0C3QK85_9AGAM|nr:hypothetical protein M407DRAFT_243580 [Tulasnella calospora MUT 4182]